MKNILFFFCMLIATPILAQPYIDLGIGCNTESDKPEVELDTPLFMFRAGYKVDKFSIEYTHVSSIMTREAGYGLNMFTINYRVVGD